MTREEAITLINSAKLMLINPTDNEPISDLYTALEMAIKALENHDTFMKYAYSLGKHDALSQEPCTDAVSREAVLNEFYDTQKSGKWIDGVHAMGYREGYKDAQKHKSGKWIDYRDDGFVECPFCGHATNCEDNIDELHYCFYCGAKMESEEV